LGCAAPDVPAQSQRILSVIPGPIPFFNGGNPVIEFSIPLICSFRVWSLDSGFRRSDESAQCWFR